ncbi:MAG: thiamine pyrophosphate-dependent enzyme [Candidatus Bathyarchaeota archaeon]|nr:thiamine pyrophosphate-dependent enzyme [Candidatus Bathyarchaeota archaeon]MDH5745784.1 thiamine pyrophosphate-dependent enzyme [Candidatus Bathyarchaeota archaeon]
MVELADLKTVGQPSWCPGCGNFPIWHALKRAIVQLNLEPHNVVIFSGIGCSSKMPHWINTYGFHGIHGRALPIATGAELANNNLTAIVVGGDGDGYGIGVGHFIHAMRRNLNMTYIVSNNQIYGLTTGQTSPTSDKGFTTKSTPTGVIEVPINPIALAIASGATYISRGFSKEMRQLTKLIVDGLRHKGFALIDVLQPCVTFNRKNTYDWFSERVYKLEETGHDVTDKKAAFLKSLEWNDRIPIGLFYREIKPTYEDELAQIVEMPLVTQRIEDIDIRPLMNEFV